MTRSIVCVAAILSLLSTGCEKKKPVATTPPADQTTMLTYASVNDSLAPSQNPPGGIPVEQTPLFVAFGFDDNGISGLDGSSTNGGLSYLTDLFASFKNPAGSGNPGTFDGTPAHFAFYATTNYIAQESTTGQSPVYVKRAWRKAIDAGNEIGCHTHMHDHGADSSEAFWEREMKTSLTWYFKPYAPDEDPAAPDSTKGIGVMPVQISGFRTPFLELNDFAFVQMKKLGFLYDCSIEEGWEDTDDGTNVVWPYTLNTKSPGNIKMVEFGTSKPVGIHPGLWELPCYAVIVPPDSLCVKYGVKAGLREKMRLVHPDYFNVADGRITGLDWNLWCDFNMTKAEFLATLKYTFDLRLKGNRAPILFGCHSDIYSEQYPDEIKNATAEERRDALKEFIAYTLQNPATRVVSPKQALDWIRKPQPLSAMK